MVTEGQGDVTGRSRDGGIDGEVVAFHLDRAVPRSDGLFGKHVAAVGFEHDIARGDQRTLEPQVALAGKEPDRSGRGASDGGVPVSKDDPVCVRARAHHLDATRAGDGETAGVVSQHHADAEGIARTSVEGDPTVRGLDAGSGVHLDAIVLVRSRATLTIEEGGGVATGLDEAAGEKNPPVTLARRLTTPKAVEPNGAEGARDRGVGPLEGDPDAIGIPNPA